MRCNAGQSPGSADVRCLQPAVRELFSNASPGGADNCLWRLTSVWFIVTADTDMGGRQFNTKQTGLSRHPPSCCVLQTRMQAQAADSSLKPPLSVTPLLE